PEGVRIRCAGPGDAADWVRTYLDSLSVAYAGFMPPEFFAQQRARAAELVERCRAEFAAQRTEPDEPHRSWLAVDAAGPVGIVEVRVGPAEWELARGFPPAGPHRQLAKLYTLPHAHGSGLGQALLDTAIGADPAYLWIMAGNPRAEAFYRRNRFVPDGLAVSAGPSWFSRPTFRMHRT
ncbi:MAG TPA: GNAT family N-acetyltransferase, partial [Pseudonocardia sp.]|nr:GNAT family N-acetyltransferase [Pseudonocardia sp.]